MLIVDHHWSIRSSQRMYGQRAADTLINVSHTHFLLSVRERWEEALPVFVFCRTAAALVLRRGVATEGNGSPKVKRESFVCAKQMNDLYSSNHRFPSQLSFELSARKFARFTYNVCSTTTMIFWSHFDEQKRRILGNLTLSDFFLPNSKRKIFNLESNSKTEFDSQLPTYYMRWSERKSRISKQWGNHIMFWWEELLKLYQTCFSIRYG